jgi:chromo domain-containing protein 1
VHPDFGNYSELPDFGQVLKRKVRVWSVGLQYGNEYDPDISTTDPPVRYDRIEVFPRGGIIYITDDVFEKRPAEALKIFELFIAKVEQCRQVAGPTDPSKLVDDGYIPWRIATRPGLMESIWTQCLAHEKEIDAQDPVQST